MIGFSCCTMAQSEIIFTNGFEIIIPLLKLNDTGITGSGDYPLGNNIGCISNMTSPQDCNVGRDATHPDPTDGIAGFSFTKLDASGTALADQSVDYATTPWSCVQDNVTGLVWEVKTPSTDVGSIHNQDNTYQWGGLTAIGRDHPDRQGIYYDGWNTLVQGSNDDTLCGFDNWRVPTVTELSSIVNRGTFNPAIDSNYFPDTDSTSFLSSSFWSSSPIANAYEHAKYITFSFGRDGIRYRDSGARVRLVRSGQ